MAENLKVTTYRNGEAIPNVTGNTEWAGLNTGAYCAYNNDNSNIDTYGFLYNWYAVEDSRNIAPDGWHVSTDDDWKTLEIYLGMSQSEADTTDYRGTNEGIKLKCKSGWYNNGNGTNESGFTALPSGYRSAFSGNYGAMGEWAIFWTSINNIDRFLHYTHSDVGRNYGSKRGGFSVRCIKD